MIFADLAKRRWAEDIPELNVQAAPRTRPTIKFHHEQSITWEPGGGAEIEFYLRPPHIDWQLGENKTGRNRMKMGGLIEWNCRLK